MFFFRIYLRFTGVPLKVGIGFVEIDFLAFLCVTLGCQKSRICKSESPRNAKKYSLANLMTILKVPL